MAQSQLVKNVQQYSIIGALPGSYAWDCEPRVCPNEPIDWRAW